MSTEVYRFEDFELEPRAYRLRRRGTDLHLERIPFELLTLFLERRGELVTREEILDRIWGKGVFIGGESAINTAVRKIRRVLNDDADAPRFIVTVASKGYRFISRVRVTSGVPLVQLRSPHVALVGRDREIGQLRTVLREAISGRGCMLLVSGAPGVGKTRLAEELAREAQTAHGVTVLIGHCIEQDESLPYLPFVEALEDYVDRSRDRNSLRAQLGEDGRELARLLPKLKRFFPDLPQPLELPVEQARRHLFHSFCDFIARLSNDHPALLLLEDLHWADDSSLSLLIHLAGRIAAMPLLVIATYRGVELSATPGVLRTLESLLRGRLVTRLYLKGLPREEVGHMLTTLSGQVPPAAVVYEFYAQTQGNPFFIEELLRYLEEENRLYDAAGQFRVELNVGELEVPESVRLVVGRRLVRLRDATQRMLTIAATIGRSFSFELLEASAGSDGLLESVDEAERAGLIFSCREESASRLEFAHELSRQAVMAGLSAPRRQRLHLEVASAIERIYADRLEDHCIELAYHYAAAGNAPKAVEYLIRSGQQARIAMPIWQRSLFLTALQLLQQLPDDEHRVLTELTKQKELAQSRGVLTLTLVRAETWRRER